MTKKKKEKEKRNSSQFITRIASHPRNEQTFNKRKKTRLEKQTVQKIILSINFKYEWPAMFKNV